MSSDKVQNFETFASSALDFPSSWSIVSWKTDESIVFEEITFNEEGKPVLRYSLTVFKSLNFDLVKSGIFLPSNKVKHICNKNLIERLSDPVNIIAYLRSDASQEDEKFHKIHHCIRLLDSLLEQEEPSSAAFKKLNFFTSQLSLVFVSIGSRRYSPSFIWTAISWMKLSPALYHLLQSEGFLTLPSCRYLKEISSSFSLETGQSKSAVVYLEARSGASDEKPIQQLPTTEVNDMTYKKYCYCSCNLMKSLFCVVRQH